MMHRLALTSLAILLAAAAASAQSDDRKSARALMAEAARYETAGQYAQAVEKAQKAVDKAGDDKETAARALQILGRSHENGSPENIDAAQGAYQRIVSEFGDQEVLAAWAQKKLEWKGVDVWLTRYHEALAAMAAERRALEIRVGQLGSNPAAVELKKRIGELKENALAAKTELSGKIQSLDRAAAPGLIAGLTHPNETVGAAAAELLAEVIDETGIAELITQLSDPARTAAAALGLNKVLEKYGMARKFEEDAQRMLEDIQDIKAPAGGGAVAEASARAVERSRESAGALQAKAAQIRRNIPASLDTPAIQEALQTVLSEGKSSAGAVEAAKALSAIGDLSGGLVDALLAGLSSPDRNVRRACSVAAGAVDPARVEDKRRIVERLEVMLQTQPEVENAPESDFANDAAVRVAAAASLGRIGMARSISALISGLSDTSEDVRHESNQALVELTGRDFGYESEPHVEDAGYKDPDPKNRTRLSEAEKREKQIAIRNEAIEKWKSWRNETEGIGTIVERFWKFQAAWKAGDPARLFDREEYLREVQARAIALNDPQEAVRRAERVATRFHKHKDFYQLDAVDAGAQAAPRLMLFLSGVLEHLQAGLSPEVQLKAQAATRMFVAETLAKIIAATGQSDLLSELREKMSGGTPEERAGAALVFGFLPRDSVSGSDREALNGALRGDREARIAAARSLAFVGDASNVSALAAAATTDDTERVQVWALRALTNIKSGGDDVVRSLGDLVGPTGDAAKRIVSPYVREAACEALGAIGNPSAVSQFYLVRARRDLYQNVRLAAARAITAIAARDSGVGATLQQILQGRIGDQRTTSAERMGAALALGDLGQDAYVDALIAAIVDRNPPIVMRDEDSAVRAAACEALGQLGDKARLVRVGQSLLAAIESDAAEQVRRSAYAALAAIAGAQAPEYDAAGTTEERRAQADEVTKWWDAQKGSWR